MFSKETGIVDGGLLSVAAGGTTSILISVLIATMGVVERFNGSFNTENAIILSLAVALSSGIAYAMKNINEENSKIANEMKEKLRTLDDNLGYAVEAYSKNIELDNNTPQSRGNLVHKIKEYVRRGDKKGLKTYIEELGKTFDLEEDFDLIKQLDTVLSRNSLEKVNHQTITQKVPVI
jgi:hypothetical protein